MKPGSSEPPAQQYGADRESRADGGQQHQIAFLQPSGADGVIHASGIVAAVVLPNRSMLMITLSGSMPSFSVAD